MAGSIPLVEVDLAAGDFRGADLGDEADLVDKAALPDEADFAAGAGLAGDATSLATGAGTVDDAVFVDGPDSTGAADLAAADDSVDAVDLAATRFGFFGFSDTPLVEVRRLINDLPGRGHMNNSTAPYQKHYA